jgi:hypothetical protein
MKNVVLWDLALCRSCVNRRFGGTSVHTRSTQLHISEDDILHEYKLFKCDTGGTPFSLLAFIRLAEVSFSLINYKKDKIIYWLRGKD